MEYPGEMPAYPMIKIFLTLFLNLLVLSYPQAQDVEPIQARVLAWSPDGSKIAIGGGPAICDFDNSAPYDVQILDAQTNQLVQVLTGFHCRITSLDWSPDSHKLAISNNETHGFQIWDIQTGQRLVTDPEGGQGMASVKWSPDGTRLAVASGGIGIADTMTGKRITIAPIGGTHIDWSPDGTKLAGGGGEFDYAVQVGDIASYTQTLQLNGNMYGVTAVDWSPDGTMIASGGGDQSVRVWDANTGQALFIFPGHTDIVNDVAWRPDSAHLASTGIDGTIIIWDTVSGQQFQQFQTVGNAYDIDWNPDGTKLAYLDEDFTLKIITPLPEVIPTSTKVSWVLLLLFELIKSGLDFSLSSR